MLRLGVLLAVGAFLACVGFFFNAENLVGYRYCLTVVAILLTSGAAGFFFLLWYKILNDFRKTEYQVTKFLKEKYNVTDRTDSL